MAGVAGAGLPAHRQRQDLLEPVLEPVLDGDAVEQPGPLPAVAGVLQLPDGGVELALGGAAEVPAVALTVQAPPDSDPGVPASVGAEVPAGGAVGRGGAWPTAHHAYPPSASRIDAMNRSSSVRSTRTDRPRCTARSRRCAICFSTRAPGPAQLGGDLVEVEQEGGLGAGCGVHTYLMPPGGGFPASCDPTSPLHDTSVGPPDRSPRRRILGPFWGPRPNMTPSGCRTERRPRPRIRRSGPSSSVSTQSAPEGIRTPNLLIRSQMLYPLSYGRPSRSRATREQTTGAPAPREIAPRAHLDPTADQTPRHPHGIRTAPRGKRRHDDDQHFR